MTKRSAFVRIGALAALVMTCAVLRGQEEPGPWVPPAGSVAGPSSFDLPPETSSSPAAYAASHAAPVASPPRVLSPVDQGYQAVPPPNERTFDPGAFPARSDVRPQTHSGPAYVPVAAAPPRETRPEPLPATPAPLPSREAFDLPRGGVVPSAFSDEVAAEADAGAAPAGDRRPLPPRPEEGKALPTAAGQFPFAASFGSLAVVLGLFFLFVWFQKSRSKRGIGALPPEVVEPLGTIPFVSRQALHVVRFGSKILLINVTAGGSETLAEIDDAREAERILALCRRNRPDPLGRTFREILGSGRDRSATGRDGGASSADRARGTAHA